MPVFGNEIQLKYYFTWATSYACAKPSSLPYVTKFVLLNNNTNVMNCMSSLQQQLGITFTLQKQAGFYILSGSGSVNVSGSIVMETKICNNLAGFGLELVQTTGLQQLQANITFGSTSDCLNVNYLGDYSAGATDFIVEFYCSNDMWEINASGLSNQMEFVIEYISEAGAALNTFSPTSISLAL